MLHPQFNSDSKWEFIFSDDGHVLIGARDSKGVLWIYEDREWRLEDDFTDWVRQVREAHNAK
jgi:hypothetical protein